MYKFLIAGFVVLAGILCFITRGNRLTTPEKYQEYIRAQLAEIDARDGLYQDAEFFVSSGRMAESDLTSNDLPSLSLPCPDVEMLPMDASGIEDPERWISPVTQAFSDIPENIRNMLLREGWSVCIKSETLDHRGSGTVIGQAIFADHRIELTAVSDQTAMVFLHEIGHIVEKKIRPELIRNGYTSRKALPDIVFHGGADTAYHEQLYGEYLANYLGESIYYRENAELAGKRFLSMYLQCIRAL